MDYIEVPGVAQVEVTALMAGQRTQNILHYKMTGATNYDATELTRLATAIIAYFNQVSVKGLYPATWQLIEVRAIDLSQQFGPAVTVGAGLPITGTRAGSQLPNNCALVLTKRTALRGRSFRGRFYFGPLCEADVTDNTVSGAVVTSILGNMAGLLDITDATTVHHFLQVVSRHAGGVPRTTGLPTQVSSLTSDGVLDSQRRRLPGRGK